MLSVLPKSPDALRFPNLRGPQELGAAYFTTAIVRAGREDWREVTMGPMMSHGLVVNVPSIGGDCCGLVVVNSEKKAFSIIFQYDM